MERRRLRVSVQGADHIRFDRHSLEALDMGSAGRIEVFGITDRVAPSLSAAEVGEPYCICDGRKQPVGVALGSDETSFCV
jgi:hypothetical protein